MPVITLEFPKVSKEQKAELVKEFSSTASRILNIPQQAFVTIINEHEPDNIGNGAELLSNKLRKT